MAIALFMDQHVPKAITTALRLRDVDVLTAHEDGRSAAPDDRLLERATELGRALFTRDVDLLQEAARRQAAGTPFAGVIYAHQLRVSIGRCVEDLATIAGAGDSRDLDGSVIFLPL
jgi:hypothetical protein